MQILKEPRDSLNGKIGRKGASKKQENYKARVCGGKRMGKVQQHRQKRSCYSTSFLYLLENSEKFKNKKHQVQLLN